MQTLGLVLVFLGLGLLRTSLSSTGWLTEEGIKVLPFVFIPIQSVVLVLFLWSLWEEKSLSTKIKYNHTDGTY